MQDVILFWSQLLGVVAEFLLTEPINWFTGIILLLFVVQLVRRIIF